MSHCLGPNDAVLAPDAVSTSTPAQRAERLKRARHAGRELHRFCFRELSEAQDPGTVMEVQSLLRLVVGLRRKLDQRKRQEETSHGE